MRPIYEGVMNTYSFRYDEEHDMWIVTVRKLGSSDPIERKECRTYGKAKRWIQEHKRAAGKQTSDLSLRDQSGNSL
jgi:hypothetical protein